MTIESTEYKNLDEILKPWKNEHSVGYSVRKVLRKTGIRDIWDILMSCGQLGFCCGKRMIVLRRYQIIDKKCGHTEKGKREKQYFCGCCRELKRDW